MSDPIYREIKSQTDHASLIKWKNSCDEIISLLVPKTVYSPREDTVLLDYCVSRLGLGNGRKLLEIGCGSGAVSISAAQRGWEVTACDINPLAVAATAGNADHNKVNLNLFEGGLEDYSEPKPTFLHLCETYAPFDLIVWNLPYLSPPLESEPRLGPLEDSGLIDRDGRSWGELLLTYINQTPTLLDEGGAIYLLHTNNARGKVLESIWRQSGWATRIVGENELGDGERLTCFSTWKPFDGNPIEWYDELDSTNRFMLDENRNIGSCVVAKKQTGGRGQRERKWITRDGDFAGSWQLDPELCGDRIGVIQLSAALSVIDTYCAIDRLPLASSHWINCATLGNSGISIRWPNDVWSEEGKIAGCLIEGRQVGEKQTVVLGIGVNIKSKDEQEFPICGLQDITDNDFTLDEFASLLNCSVASLFEQHPLSCPPNHHYNPIWQLMSNYLSKGKSLLQEGVKLTISGITDDGQLLCHDGSEVRIISNSFTSSWV